MIPALMPSGTFNIDPLMSDTRQLPQIAYGIYATNAGSIKFKAEDGSVGTRYVEAGGTLVMAVKQVFVTGTTVGMGLQGNKVRA